MFSCDITMVLVRKKSIISERICCDFIPLK
jgi:hypothetical protein